MSQNIHVTTEIGHLRRLLIHPPDEGIGKIVPRITDQLLYDDIVDLSKMRQEYSEYMRVLLCFLDADKIKNKSNDPAYRQKVRDLSFDSDYVLTVESLLRRILSNDDVKTLLVASVCAIEKCGLKTQKRLLETDPAVLAHTLITGIVPASDGSEEFIFAPIPNLIFTRDIGITLQNHILINKPYEAARNRESLLFKYIAHFNLLNQSTRDDPDRLADRVIEIKELDLFFFATEEEKRRKNVSIEGGDVMMISPGHLLVGISERTSVMAIDYLVEQLFDKNLIQKVSVVKIPQRRSYMHIDTVFTQVRRDLWILFSPFSKEALTNRIKNFDFAGNLSEAHTGPVHNVEITQFLREERPRGRYGVVVKKLSYLDDLFTQISCQDFGAQRCEIIPCAGGAFPDSEREQWTDACNFLAIREGVVIGYDRNVKTEAEFRKRGFAVMCSSDIIQQVEAGAEIDEVVTGDTLILLPSGELSRARGGTHCMSMPLQRDDVAVWV
jgi:arginine deiminase